MYITCRHPYVINIEDANISHFLQVWLAEPITFFYRKVNENCTPYTVLSINLLSGFCAVEATICSCKIFPSQYFDDVEARRSYYIVYKQPQLSVTCLQYMNSIHCLGMSQTCNDQAWITPGSACGDLVDFQLAISQRCVCCCCMPTCIALVQ